ncbi:MAG: hypothetical protein COV44_03215 [Deltaproteobacteria bacterium CG11_big_fil_rev_8_21_14_0_20_45_16]|nr:MAG: hypothetical protein COV44_03215 [Deltaproteobacteria bacterium CG11_big_fil_rev_8_21_14_0_20_45_16]
MNLLIVDDEENLLKLLSLNLKKPNRSIFTANNAAEAFKLFQENVFDIVLCDIGLPDTDGIQLLKSFKQTRSNTPVIMITAHGSVDTAISSMKEGAYDYVQKPFEAEEIEFVVDRAIRESRLQADYNRLRQQIASEFNFSNILGNSPKMKNLFERMRKAASTKSTVLVLGESGTGKEMIARAIHFNSERKNKPFVVIDCGAIPANLLESELFGHIKGAFTGAENTKKGLCEEADGGSLFLDEIGELPIELQSKLLRLLQESSIRRVGDTKNISLDVRIIAATNKNLEAEVKEKKFREDLFYRLNVVALTPPALRERREDIPLLADFFVKKYAREYKRDIEKISHQVLSRLAAFDWPGNVRQLENVVEQMVVMSESKILDLDNLPPPLSDGIQVAAPIVEDRDWDLKKAVSNVTAYTEEFMIRRALEHTGQNKTKAAELLGLSRRALIYKTQEYKIGSTQAEDLADNAD